MAFTKAPSTDNHNVQRILPTDEPLLVSTLVNAFGATNNNRFYNCYPLVEKQNGDNPVLRVHKRGGYDFSTTTNSFFIGSNRGGTFTAQATSQLLNNIFYTYGAGFYMLDLSTKVNTQISITGVLNYLGTLSNAIDGSNVRKIACLEGGGGAAVYLTLCNEDGTTITTTNLATVNVDGSKGLVFIDGYLFAVNRTGTRIYNSDPNGALTTWNTTNFLDAEQYPDPVLYIEKHKNYLVAFGSASTEFFYNNSIEVGSPLARQESYSTRVGLAGSTLGGFNATWSRYVARVGDDLYFLGTDETTSIGLYRIRDFKVQPVGDNSFARNLFNAVSRGQYAISTYWLDNNVGILVELLNSANDGGGLWMYMIDTDSWVQIGGADTPSSANGLICKPLNMINPSDGNVTSSPFYLTGSDGQTPKLWSPTDGVTVTATYTTKPIDFGVNRWKSIGRVDAIGDFSTNTLTLAFGKSMNYSTAPTNTYSIVPNTIGYQANVSWYNLGAYRQFYLQLTMAGTAPCIFSAFDVEYNIGVS